MSLLSPDKPGQRQPFNHITQVDLIPVSIWHVHQGHYHQHLLYSVEERVGRSIHSYRVNYLSNDHTAIILYAGNKQIIYYCKAIVLGSKIIKAL